MDTSTPAGERKVYGPFDVDDGRQKLMQSASRFVPAKGEHIQSSELCATCHTLITHALDDDGKVVGELPEQIPYLEWKHSAYAGEKSCQSCHMPVVEGSMQVSSVLGSLPRGGLAPRLPRWQSPDAKDLQYSSTGACRSGFSTRASSHRRPDDSEPHDLYR